jgi:muramoyltetrapeptide carboxypeptidase
MKPPRLKSGSLVGLVAPASCPSSPSPLHRGQRFLEELGFRVKPGRHLLDCWGYLAGSDECRANDLNDMFADQAVKAIFCIRGGYGAARLLPLLDFESLKSNPKILMGYSDITALELAILRKIGLVTFYGPMVTTEMAGDFPEDSRERMLATLTRCRPPRPIGTPTGEGKAAVIHPGQATGPLVGGCLSILVSLLGTDYVPDMEGAILFLEDVDEEPYRLDRYLTQLRLSGRLENVAGVALGQWVRCEHNANRSSFRVSLSCQEVLRDRLGDLGVPVLSGLGFGHGRFKATLPQGVQATLDASRGILRILEPGVC